MAARTGPRCARSFGPAPGPHGGFYPVSSLPQSIAAGTDNLPRIPLHFIVTIVKTVKAVENSGKRAMTVPTVVTVECRGFLKGASVTSTKISPARGFFGRREGR